MNRDLNGKMKPVVITTFPPEIGDADLFQVEKMERDFWSLGSPPASQDARIITPKDMKRMVSIIKQIKENCEEWNRLVGVKNDARLKFLPKEIERANKRMVEIFYKQAGLFSETHGFSRTHLDKCFIQAEEEEEEDETVEPALSEKDNQSIVRIVEETRASDPSKLAKICRSTRKAHDVAWMFDTEVRKVAVEPLDKRADDFWEKHQAEMKTAKLHKGDYCTGSITRHPSGKLNTIVTINWNILFVTSKDMKFEDCAQIPPGLVASEVITSLNIFPDSPVLEEYKKLCCDCLAARRKVDLISGRTLKRELAKMDLLRSLNLDLSRPEVTDSIFMTSLKRNQGLELNLPLFAIRILMLKSLTEKPKCLMEDEFDLFDDHKKNNQALAPFVLSKEEVSQFNKYLKPLGALSDSDFITLYSHHEGSQGRRTAENK